MISLLFWIFPLSIRREVAVALISSGNYVWFTLMPVPGITYWISMSSVLISVKIPQIFFLFKTRAGLNLRAIGENPGTADAAGINVSKYKYAATVTGAAIAGLGGLYFVMEYLGGTWSNNGFGDRGWLAIALVILALWNPDHAIW